ncbi:hypothetical protein ACPBEI_07265 [Latilactobacillus sakei]
MRSKLKATLMWLQLNIWVIMMLVGMTLIAVAAFFVDIAFGLFTAGMLLIIVSKMAERG